MRYYFLATENASFIRARQDLRMAAKTPCRKPAFFV
jgi:hypothetical protein